MADNYTMRCQMQNGTMLTALGAAIYTSPLRWVIMLAPLGMVFAFGAVANRTSAAGAQLFFYAFAGLMGLSLSSIFVFYTTFSIIQTFLVTAIAFAGLSLWGYTTKKDISGWGSFLIMGVIGILVASIINTSKTHISPMHTMAIRNGWTNLRSTVRCSCI